MIVTHRTLLRLLMSALLPVLLSACAMGALTSSHPPTSPRPPMSQWETTTVTQRLTFRYGEETHRLIGILRHDASTLRLALLAPQGQRLLTLVADDHAATFLPDAAFEPPFSAEWLTDRLVWSLWPTASLQSTFTGTDWRILQSGSDREIRYRGNLIALITRHQACTVIDDREAGYQLATASLDAPATACSHHD